MEATRLHEDTDRALFCTFGGLSFGDIALVPATFLKNPRGIRDLQEWYLSVYTRPDYIKRVFKLQCEVAIENLWKLYEAVGDRITVIQTNGTDFGTQNGPFCSHEVFRDLYKPYQKQVNGWIHEHTPWKTLMHCCGGVEPLLDDIIEAEFDILNPVQCSAAGMAPQTLKRDYGDRITFWGGGIDTQHTLPFGTPDEVRQQAQERIDILAPGGGYVFAAIHNVVASVPLENVLALMEVVGTYR
jgi:uroporphyrinogen-III decarboxylase